jgi:LysR family cyn operon transcriptional activator
MRDPSSIELRHLRAFVTVADTRSFTRAAERLGISQPSISIQIRELETALGAQLFHRLGQGVALSPAGRALHPRATLVLGKLSDACQAVQASEDLLAGHLSVAIIPLLNVPWMPPVLGRLSSEHPGLAVTVTEKSSDDVELAVRNGTSDLGLGFLTRASPTLTYELLRKDQLMLLQRPDGPFGRKRSVTAPEVAAARLVVLPESYVIRQLTDSAFRAARVLPRYAFEVDTVESTLATVIASNLCTLMPGVVLQGREHLGLRALKLKDWGEHYELGLIWPGEGPSDAAGRAFARYLRECIR